MEQNKLPKNIRQIGEKEDWIRVYIEDYVHTYIQRLRGLEESGVSGGLLLGRKQRVNGIMHLFIRGAVVAEDPFWHDPGQTPEQLKAENSVYFPDLEICGFFVSSRQNRSSEVDLVRIFETHFPSEYQILFDVRDQDEEIFSYSGHSLIRLAGYYIYYEKNEEMQSYIIRQESLRVLEQKNGEKMQGNPPVKEVKNQAGSRADRPGKSGKRIMGIPGRDRPGGKEDSTGTKGPGMVFGGDRSIKTDTGQADPENERRMAAGKKPSAGKKVKKGDLIVRIVSVAGIFILAFLLFSDQIKFNKVDETSADSSGVLSSILNETSMVQAGADSGYIETGSAVEIGGGSDTASGDNGAGGDNGTGSDNETGGGNGISGESGESSGVNSNSVISSDDGSGSSGKEDGSGDSSKENESGSGQEGAAAGADVRQTAGGSDSNESDSNESDSKNSSSEGSDSKSGDNTDTGSGNKMQGASSSYVFPMRYLVKKGDSLYSICEKYYGDTSMVDAVCLENDISDPSKLQYGVVLTLPER